MSVIRILIIAPITGPITGENKAINIYIQQVKKNKSISIVVLDRSTEMLSLKKVILKNIIFVLKYIFYINTKNPQVIYILLGQKRRAIIRDSFIILLAMLYGKKIIAHLHGGDFKKYTTKEKTIVNQLVRSVYSRINKIIILSESLMGQFSNIMPLSRIFVVHNTCEYYHFNYRATKPNLIYSPLEIVFISNVLPRKGLFDLLLALIILSKRSIAFNFTFAGNIIPDGDYSDRNINFKIHDIIRKGGIEKNIQILGPISEKQKWQLLRKAHVFVIPSLYNEGEPISLIEAQCAGCPILATKVGGIRDMIVDGLNGYFIKKQSPDDIAQKLEMISRNPSWYLKASHFSRQHALKKYNIYNYVNNINHLLLMQ